MSRENERNSSIELLRILAGMAVVILHFNFFPGGGGAVEYAHGFGKIALIIIESGCICAVNVFVLISGWFNIESYRINVARLLAILIQTCVFSFGFKFLSCFMCGVCDVKGLLYALMPINYYVILYITLMILAPFVNTMVNSLSDKGKWQLLVISNLLLCIYPTFVDIIQECAEKNLSGLSSIGLEGSGGGYTIVNFLLVYVTGACIRKLDIVNKVREGICYIVLLVVIVAITLWHMILPDTAWMYSNPLVIFEAVIVFVVFAKMEFHNKVINAVAPASFTCYLINVPVLKTINELLEYGTVGPSIAGKMIVSVMVIYVVSVIIMLVWNCITKPIYHCIIKKIPIVIIQGGMK